MMPQFSIITPVYKAERTIHKCIKSILAQTIVDFELILVDDGSPDSSGEICDKFALTDKRIKVIHKKNGGASDARNTALGVANGNRICFVDSDDVVDEDFLEIFAQKDADIVVQGMYRNDKKAISGNKEYYASIKEGDFDIDNANKFIEILCDAENVGYLVTRSFKREIIENNNLKLDTRYKLREDQEFILRYMLKCKTFATINRGAYHYDIPINFVMKYSHVDSESNILCTFSIMENFEKLAKMPQQMLVENINILSDSFLKMYKTRKIDVPKINKYLKLYCTYYKRCKKESTLSRKSHFIYYVIGSHTPIYLHKLYNKLLYKSR